MNAINQNLRRITYAVVILGLTGITLQAQTLLLEQNIYISNPKPVRNEVDPKALEREKREKEARKVGRRLAHFLNGESGDPFSFYHPTKNRLYANRFWKVEINPESHGTKTEIEVSVNQGETFSYRQPLSIPFAGLNEFRYRAVDQLQNEEPWKLIFIIRDDVGPKIQVGYEGPSLVLDQTVFVTKQTVLKVQSEDEDSGVLHQFVRVGEGDWSIIENNSVSFQDLQGKQKISLASLDPLYNRSNLLRFQLHLVSEIRVPYIESEFVTFSDADAICNRKSSVWFPKIEHPIPYNVYWRKKDKGEFRKYVRGNVLLEDAIEGEEYQLEYFTKDELGNQSKMESWKCKFDSKPPTTTIQRLEVEETK